MRKRKRYRIKSLYDNKLDYYNNDDNEGHIMIALYNNTDEEVTIQDGERVAQGVFLRYYTSGEQIETERKGGIGSTNG